MRRTIIGFIAAILLLSLPGCTPAQAGAQEQSETDYLKAKPSSLPLQMKLGIGILKMEGTELAISAAQAEQLLPLWKALRSLSSDTNTTAEEINALNRQIEEILTPGQTGAIEKMTWTAEEINQLMQKFGGTRAGPGGDSTGPSSNEITAGGMGGGGMPGGPGGAPGGMGGPPMDGGMMMGPGGPGMENLSAGRTAVPGQAERRQAAGMNLMFVEPVIRLLESKISG